jgi:hypothetical protein
MIETKTHYKVIDQYFETMKTINKTEGYPVLIDDSKFEKKIK